LGTSGEDQGYSVKQTSDGGYILTGFSYNNSQQNVYLIKLDKDGNLIWEKFFEDTLQGIGYSVDELPGRGYIVMGLGSPISDTGTQSPTLFLLKTDLNGGVISCHFFTPPSQIAFQSAGNMPPYFFSLSQTKDNGYIISGRANYSPSTNLDYTNIWLLKLNSTLEEEWETILERESNYFPATVQETTDGSYIITGITEINWSRSPQNDYDVFLIKTDSQGKESWERTFDIGDINWKNDFAIFGKESSDNSYLITGFAEISGGGFCDIFLLKTNKDGKEQWRKTFNHQSWDWAYSLIETKDQGYLIVGGTDDSNPIADDVYLIKTDSRGNLVWSKTLGESDQSEIGFSIAETSDGGYIIIGTKDKDIWLIKLGVEIPVPLE